MINNLPFNSFGLEDDEIERFSETFNKLKTRFQPNFKDDFDFSFKGFETFSNCANVDIEYVIDLNIHDNSSFITFSSIEYYYSGSKGGEREGCEYQTWGFCTMQKDFGNILIRQETLADKIVELIKPIELDFEDDSEFSKKFYVITNDKDKARVTMNSSFRKAILEIPINDFVIEINNKTLIIGNHKIVDPVSTFYFAEFLNKVSSMH